MWEKKDDISIDNLTTKAPEAVQTDALLFHVDCCGSEDIHYLVEYLQSRLCGASYCAEMTGLLRL